METCLKKMQCGNCGGSKHELYEAENGDILVKCVECSNVSRVTITQPKIEVKNERGDGRITVF